MSRLARLSAAKGGKTRAIVKLLGRGAIVLAASALDLTPVAVLGGVRAARLLLVLQGRGRADDASSPATAKLRLARRELAMLAAPLRL